jgi:predicted enzyme involved in methoxymalonyl-ACP biosynthesis
MLSTLKARKSAPSDLTGFLRSLQMKLKIQNKTKNDWQRAIQLINKTNQFNK